jgi:hypothetical protein
VLKCHFPTPIKACISTSSMPSLTDSLPGNLDKNVQSLGAILYDPDSADDIDDDDPDEDLDI